MMKDKTIRTVRNALALRFGEDFSVDETLAGLDELSHIAARRVIRKYLDRTVDPKLLRLLCACALSAPTKSDLQQADIIIVSDAAKLRVIADLIPDQPFIRSAPAFLIFLANGRRLPAITKLRAKPFPNDHLDLFFNATVDAAIALATFVRAADAVGIGTCPISVIRDHATRLTELLALPERVIPLAGLCVGWPAEAGHISARLPLSCTLHENTYDEGDLAARIDAYDRRRAAIHPHKPRDPARWGSVPFYGWSEDKARQYGVPQRTDFGTYVRKQGFRLD
jgi:nitroreductase